MISRLLFGTAVLLLSASSSAAYEWTYTNPGLVVPAENALAGTAAAWAEANRANLEERLTAPVPVPVSDRDGGWVQFDGYSLLQVIFEYPSGVILHGQYVGGFIAKPDVVDPDKPLVIALHGHEVAERGRPPAKLFLEHWWVEELAQAGYAVWAPSHLLYEQLASLYGPYDYHQVWTDWVAKSIDQAAPRFPAHDGYAIAGLSSGGTTAAFVMARRPDIRCGVFAGSLLSLDFLRRNYRSANGINQWEMRDVYSYLPFYLLMAPRPVQFQLGELDPFYPNGTRFHTSPRDVTMPEIIGEFMVMERAWANFPVGGTVDLHLHGSAHVMDVPALLGFLAGCP